MNSGTSFIFTLTGNSSILEAFYFPPIELSENSVYGLGLVDLWTYNSIPNIDDRLNKIHFTGGLTITIPTGSYELSDLEDYIKKRCEEEGITFHLKGNNNTLRCELESSKAVDFTQENSIGKLLGFRGILKENILHTSQEPVSIISVNAIRVECNIVSGAYLNNQKSFTLYEFFPSVDPGYKIIELPSPVIYLPVSRKVIDRIELRLVDQNGELINLQKSELTVRLHLKKWE